MWIECSSDVFKAVADEILEQLVPLAIRLARKKKPQSVPTVSTGDKGRIGFSHERGAYVVMYKKPDGTRSSSSKGLRVHTHTAAGSVLDSNAYKRELARAKRAAMQLWNDLDASTAVRYAIAGVGQE